MEENCTKMDVSIPFHICQIWFPSLWVGLLWYQQTNLLVKLGPYYVGNAQTRLGLSES